MDPAEVAEVAAVAAVHVAGNPMKTPTSPWSIGRLTALLSLIFLAAGAVAAAPPVPKTDAATLRLIDAAIAGEHRSAKSKARDVYRHPRETLQFFGLRKDMSIVEIAPGGGWYTDILAPVVKDHGHYVAALAPPASTDAEDAASTKAIKKKFADHAAVLGTLNIASFGSQAIDLAPEGTVDMVVTFRNLHNWMGGGWADKAIAAMYKALKPGGILGIEEHRGNSAVAQDPKADSGYVNEDHAIKLFEAAGFKLVGKSEINANPKDTKDYKEGVWTLPPTLTLGEKDKDKYAAIGESDRFTLKFQKPPAVSKPK